MRWERALRICNKNCRRQSLFLETAKKILFAQRSRSLRTAQWHAGLHHRLNRICNVRGTAFVAAFQSAMPGAMCYRRGRFREIRAGRKQKGLAFLSGTLARLRVAMAAHTPIKRHTTGNCLNGFALSPASPSGAIFELDRCRLVVPHPAGLAPWPLATPSHNPLI